MTLLERLDAESDWTIAGLAAAEIRALHSQLSAVEAERDELKEKLETAQDDVHYANGVCDLALKHRDIAEATLTSTRNARDRARELDPDALNAARKAYALWRTEGGEGGPLSAGIRAYLAAAPSPPSPAPDRKDELLAEALAVLNVVAPEECISDAENGCVWCGGDSHVNGYWHQERCPYIAARSTADNIRAHIAKDD